jgi:hypothetical protein
VANHVDDKRIYISIYLNGHGFVPAGVILFNETLNYAGFVYYKSYADNGYPPLNPGTLNYQTQRTLQFPVDVRTNKEMLDKTFWELLPENGDFGTNVLMSRYPEYFSMRKAQKLYFLGSRVVGGLSCYVERNKLEENITSEDWLDEVRKESVAFYTQKISSIRHVQGLDALTSYGGVRPKAMYKDERGQYWIAKFNVPSDPYNMARVEHMAMLMAKDSGLEVPETKVLTLPSGEDVFLSKRFDRLGNKRAHGLSFFAVAPAIDFERERPKAGEGHSALVMAQLVRRFSTNKRADQEELAKKLMVDVGFHNTDNHLRNIRFILNDRNEWSLAPSFDILFDPRERPHTYGPAGLSAEETHLNNEKVTSQIASFTDLSYEQVASFAQATQESVDQVESFAAQVQLSEQDLAKVQNALTIGTLGPAAMFRIEQAKRAKHAPTPKPTLGGFAH